MKKLALGDLVDIDGCNAIVRSINEYSATLVLDEGTFCEYVYECPITDIELGDDGWYVNTDKQVSVGDVVTLDVNDHEYKVINIEDGVLTMKRQGDIKNYSLSDINYDVSYGWCVCSYVEETMSVTDKRKLAVYEVQDNVYEYNSLDELKEIYSLLGNPSVEGHYGLDYENINVFIDSLQYSFGLLVFWTEWDSEWDYTYKYIKVIEGAVMKGYI